MMTQSISTTTTCAAGAATAQADNAILLTRTDIPTTTDAVKKSLLFQQSQETTSVLPTN